MVYARPRAGFVVGGAIRFGFGISIGAAFRPWGWGGNRFVWNSHSVFINERPWGRTWVNRREYVHPYEIWRPLAPRPPEPHVIHERSPREREAERGAGHKRVEDHKAPRDGRQSKDDHHR